MGDEKGVSAREPDGVDPEPGFGAPSFVNSVYIWTYMLYAFGCYLNRMRWFTLEMGRRDPPAPSAHIS